ncbi:MAG TPA: 3-deoxy-manno-octulosonate cytidylyltransferase [Rhodospirillales bacterium]|nr:3-deoxy-manno-octulosonate cytidylyltransferase [Rhodospirillales bacterium]
MSRIFGIVPARMASSRFPGKPLAPIRGRPMVEHVFERARRFDRWDGLFLATCDHDIAAFGDAKDWPTIMTGDHHVRALDRVAEAVGLCGHDVTDDDVVVCVQADEPLLSPDEIEAVTRPFDRDPTVDGTVLAMHIVDEAQFLNPDIVKLVHDMKGDVLYTSRSPIPHCKAFSPELGALRIGGIFGFRWRLLRAFSELPESPLEIAEACDSNRLLDNGFRQRVAPVPYRPYFSVDSPADRDLVEAAMADDPLWGGY